MTTPNKKLACALAKTLSALSVASWNSDDKKNNTKTRIIKIRKKLTALFEETGYEFTRASGCRIRLRKD